MAAVIVCEGARHSRLNERRKSKSIKFMNVFGGVFTPAKTYNISLPIFCSCCVTSPEALPRRTYRTFRSATSGRLGSSVPLAHTIISRAIRPGASRGLHASVCSEASVMNLRPNPSPPELAHRNRPSSRASDICPPPRCESRLNFRFAFEKLSNGWPGVACACASESLGGRG